jgi:hypothetical protein
VNDDLPRHLQQRYDAYLQALSAWYDRYGDPCPTCGHHRKQRGDGSPAAEVDWDALEAEYQAIRVAAGEHVDTDNWG